MSAAEHLLLRASAGTGKTYALSSRYLALVLGGVDPDRVLATTFTRKAAHEILDRILARLADAAAGGERLAELSRSVGSEVRAEECLALLERLLRGIDRVRIGTLDAYFAQVARLFALDLGLPPAWRIADESESKRLRSEAVADAIAGAGKLELLELLRDSERHGVGQSAHETLLRLVEDGREKLLESPPEAWERVRELPDVDPGTLAAARDAWPRFPLAKTKAGKDKARWAAAKEKIALCLEQNDWVGLLEVTLVERSIAGEAFDGTPLDGEQQAFLGPLAAHALHVRTREIELANRASRALLERYERSYKTRARDRGLLRFEDVPSSLAALSGEDPIAGRGLDLADRLDGRIDHLLLDEFQDTAPVQWRVMRPLADAILADPPSRRSLFCVGDEKQSIYGWRAAEPELLRRLDRDRPALRSRPLLESYRSSRAVLDAVNRVFGSIARNPALGGADPEVLEAAAAFEAAFPKHLPARERPGAVFLVRTRPCEEGEAEEAPVLEAAVERVRAILADAPGASVGVLVRVRKRIPELIQRLRDAGIQASDQGGNPLTDSAAVLHALALLHLADHPGDTAAAFHVASSPLGALGLGAREVRARLARQGLGGFLASIRPAGGYGEWDLGRFDQLVDLALAFESRAGSRPGEFVEHVRATKIEDPGSAQVRVMTIHGAKGLEFDAVVLPDLEPRQGNGEQLLWSRPDPEGPIEIVTHGLAKKISAAHLEIDAARREVARRDVVESLCVLYVAMTRAVHRLDLVVRGREKEGSGRSHARILLGAFGAAASGPAGVAWTCEESAPRWFRDEIGPAAAATVPTPRPEAPRRLRLAPSRGPRAANLRSPSRAADQERVDVGRILLSRDARTSRGRMMHRLLQEVEWLEAFDRSDEELDALALALDADRELAVAARADFRRAIARPETARLLARPAGELEVWRERPFSVLLDEPGGEAALWTGAFDRVVVRIEKGQPVSAEIVDFKTGPAEGEVLAERIESYRPQLNSYRRVLSKMLDLDASKIRIRLAFLDADRVVDA